MCAKTRNITATSRTRKGVSKRVKKQNVIRGRRKAETTFASILGNTLYTIRLKNKSGAEIMFKSGTYTKVVSPFYGDNYEIDPVRMYNDLYKCCKRAFSILKPEIVLDNPSKLFSTTYECMDYVVNQFQSLLPEDWEFNIDRDQRDNYVFTIYRTCPFPAEFHAFDICQAVKKMSRNSPALHSLFVKFIANFLNTLHIEPWWNLMDYTFDHIEEVLECDDDLDDDIKTRMYKSLAIYKEGKAYEFQVAVQSCDVQPLSFFFSEIRKFRKNNPIAQLIEQGCKLMESGYNFSRFQYESEEEEERGYYLRLDGQVSIVWSFEDDVWSDFEEYMNCDAQEGTQDPIVSLVINSKTDAIDFEKLEEERLFPMRVSQFYNTALHLIRSYEQ